LTNEHLAHELLFDMTFQLSDSGTCGMENQVNDRLRKSFHRAFWNSTVDDLRLTPPCYTRVLRVLAEIRDAIRELAGQREAVTIDEIVDISHIQQQAEVGAFTWQNCIDLVGGVVGVIHRIQPPARDSEMRELWTAMEQSMLSGCEDSEKPSVMCKALEFMQGRTNLLRIDAANARYACCRCHDLPADRLT
jgi:hypothetical protein